MTPNEKRRKLNAVTRFDNAAQNYAFMGAAHPEQWAEIERSYLTAKARLLRELGFEAYIEAKARSR